jgi:D-aminoacyl-tRNA deacylase
MFVSTVWVRKHLQLTFNGCLRSSSKVIPTNVYPTKAGSPGGLFARAGGAPGERALPPGAQTMRAIIQRVSEAGVVIKGNLKAGIRKGLLVLVAVEEADTQEDIEWLSGKIVQLRVFDDEAGVMNRSVQEIQGDILAVSQFTLYASTKKGNRPSYSRAARPEIAIPLYNSFITRLQQDLGRPVQTGEFGAQMLVHLTNDGPVTILIDSKTRE